MFCNHLKMEDLKNEVYLRCESHYIHLTKQLKQFYDDKLFTNVILRSTKTSGYERIVHFTVLYSLLDQTSFLFKSELDGNKKIIFIPCESSVMNNFIDILYFGKTIINYRDIPHFTNLISMLNLSVAALENADIEVSLPNRKSFFLDYIWNLKSLNSGCDLLFLSSEFLLCHSHCEIISAQVKQLIKINNSRIDKIKPMVIVLQNIIKEDIELVIEFCYKGRLTIHESKLEIVKKIASLLLMDNLLEILHANNETKKVDLKNEEDVSIERPPAKPRKIIVDLIKENPNYGYCYIWHGNKCITVHAVIMKTFCPFFARVYDLIDWKEKDVAVIINTFNYMEIKAVIDFIYMGEANLVVDECGINKELVHWLGLTIPENSIDLRIPEFLANNQEEESNVEKNENKENNNVDLKTETGIIQCEICLKQFKSPRTFSNHYKKRHETPEIYKCEKCGKVFLKRCNLKRHENMHNSPEYQCEKCGKFYSNKDYLEEHNRSHTGDKPFICPVCFKKFTGKTGLNHHLRIHDKTRNDMFVCDMCGKEFSRQGLWGHMKTHSKEYKCSICNDKNFATPSALKRHVKWVHEKHPPLKCTFCNSEYELKSLLHRHMVNEHKFYNGEFIKRKAYACEKCSQSFHTSARLQKHILTRHNNKELLPCNYCGKVLSGSSAIKYHMRSHTGERPHTCNFCSKSFTRPDLLKKHMRLHTGERFMCPLCNKSFTSKHYLTEHSWTHDIAINVEQCTTRQMMDKKKQTNVKPVIKLSDKELPEDPESRNLHFPKTSLVQNQNYTPQVNKCKAEETLTDPTLEIVNILDSTDLVNNIPIVTEIFRENLTLSNQNNFVCQQCFHCSYSVEELISHSTFCSQIIFK